MERAFNFGQHNTWIDWHLLLTDKEISPPEIKSNYIELDGVSGTVDLTEALAGKPVYKDRSLYATFFTDEGTYEERERMISQITNRLHGRKMPIVEPDDLTHYFSGRVWVKHTRNHITYAEVEIEAVCDPWRYDNEETVRTYTVNGAQEVALYNYGAATLCPDITVTGSITAACNGVTTSMTDGTYKIATFKLFEGENIIGLSGSGTLTLKYRRATL